jgi:tRNA dimethylallyltransferase
MGPTASGKTAAVAQMARRLPIELISVDSALVFATWTSAPPSRRPTNAALCPHHLIDIVSRRKPIPPRASAPTPGS